MWPSLSIPMPRLVILLLLLSLFLSLSPTPSFAPHFISLMLFDSVFLSLSDSVSPLPLPPPLSTVMLGLSGEAHREPISCRFLCFAVETLLQHVHFHSHKVFLRLSILKSDEEAGHSLCVCVSGISVSFSGAELGRLYWPGQHPCGTYFEYRKYPTRFFIISFEVKSIHPAKATELPQPWPFPRSPHPEHSCKSCHRLPTAPHAVELSDSLIDSLLLLLKSSTAHNAARFDLWDRCVIIL